MDPPSSCSPAFARGSGSSFQLEVDGELLKEGDDDEEDDKLDEEGKSVTSS